MDVDNQVYPVSLIRKRTLVLYTKCLHPGVCIHSLLLCLLSKLPRLFLSSRCFQTIQTAFLFHPHTSIILNYSLIDGIHGNHSKTRRNDLIPLKHNIPYLRYLMYPEYAAPSVLTVLILKYEQVQLLLVGACKTAGSDE